MSGFGSRKNFSRAKIFAALVIAAVAAGLLAGGSRAAEPVIKDADVVIQIGGITPQAKFFPVEVEGSSMEVIAVRAPDGTVRTAFNTCQICYDSGRGSYVQEGNALVCQNCGNRFRMDQVEVVSGGCNPVPIFPQNKTVTDETITIPYSFLQRAKAIFANWKTEY